MNPIVFHLISADAYFTGHVLLILCLLTCQQQGRRRSQLSALCGFIGVIFIALTAVPTSPVVYAVWFCAAVVWIMDRLSKDSRPLQRKFRLSTIALILAGTAISELSWRLPLRFDKIGSPALIIFGDSVTAGIGENEAETWPSLLEETTSLKVLDYSKMGATVGSELDDLTEKSLPPGLIIVELGGNDLLGTTTVDEFRTQLDQFLQQLTATGQPVVMFELPVPPFLIRFGIAQRQIAMKHDVQLIPKHIFARVLAGNQSTLDSIHLSQQGHELMAKLVWEQIEHGFE